MGIKCFFLFTTFTVSFLFLCFYQKLSMPLNMRYLISSCHSMRWYLKHNFICIFQLFLFVIIMFIFCKSSYSLSQYLQCWWSIYDFKICWWQFLKTRLTQSNLTNVKYWISCEGFSFGCRWVFFIFSLFRYSFFWRYLVVN